MTSLRDRTITGAIWSFVQNLGARLVLLISTIVLARLLTPEDFGLIGMLTIFIVLSQTLINAGFSQALIRKVDADDEDFSAVFYINLVVSVILYFILYALAPLIAKFYSQPQLVALTRVLALTFIINVFSYVQEARLTKEMQFKKLSLIYLPSTLISGVVAIFMAMLNFGVWSIVALQIVMRLTYAIQIWIRTSWRPIRSFNYKKAKSLFSFGSKLMISGVIHILFDNIYLVIIGKFFPLNILGYYQNAKKMVDVPTHTVSNVLSNVTFSAFSSIQNDDSQLREGYRKVIQQALFWLCPLLTFAAVTAEPLFVSLMTEKWLPAVPFFQILCFVGILYPLNAYNLSIINVKGRSDLFLKLEILKKVITIIGVIITVQIDIWALITFQVINSLIAYLINSYYSGRFIKYPIRAQVYDLLPIIILCATVGSAVWAVNSVTNHFLPIVRLAIGLATGMTTYLLASGFCRLEPFVEFQSIVKARLCDK